MFLKEFFRNLIINMINYPACKESDRYKLGRGVLHKNIKPSLVRKVVSDGPNQAAPLQILIKLYTECLNTFDSYERLTLYLCETPKGGFLKTVKTQMKCCMLHFIRAFTVCKVQKNFFF